ARAPPAGRAHARALGGELPAVLDVLAKGAAHVDHLAGLHVGQRARHRDLLALVGHPDEHREIAVGQPPANGGDLQRELRAVGVLHQRARVRLVWDNARTWAPWAPSSPRSSRRSPRTAPSTRTPSSRCCTPSPSTARTASWSVAPP